MYTCVYISPPGAGGRAASRRTSAGRMDAANGVVQVATASAAGAVSAGFACPSPPPQPPTTTLLLPLPLLAIVVVVVVAYTAVYRWYYRRARGTLDGPDAYPIVGTMYVMHGYRYRPFHRFTELARRYGPVYMMRMGGTPCAIVSGYPAIKEVLIANGPKFGGRFDFARYDALFNGDRNNCEYHFRRQPVRHRCPLPSFFISFSF